MKYQVGDILVATNDLVVYDTNNDDHTFHKGSYFVIVSKQPKRETKCDFVLLSQRGSIVSEWYKNGVERCFIKQ
jgi:hypothetical protein